MRENSQRLKYIIADFLSVNAAWLLFNLIRYRSLPAEYTGVTFGSYYAMSAVQLGQIIFPLMMVALYAVSGYYNRPFRKSRIDEALNTAGVSALGTAVIFFTTLYNDNINDRLHNLEMILILWGLFTLVTLLPRLIITIRTRRRINSGELAFGALIVGLSPKAVALARNLSEKYPQMGLAVRGYVNTEGPGADRSALPPDAVVVDIEEAEAAADRLGVRAFVIVHDGGDKLETVALINRLFPTGRSIYITPDIHHFITARPRTSTIAGEILIDVAGDNVSQSTLNIKRIVDITVSALALVVLSPLLAVLAVMVRRSSPGPVIYSQERVGYHKRRFRIYKFRSMYVDSEKDGPALSSADDPRITGVGRVLRKYRLDELPQFWNVLRGDMSLVGPRPERQYYLDRIVERAPYFSLLHRVRPGITSWGMVKFGYASSVDQMIERYKYDLLYLDNMSLAVDMKILLYTIRTVVTGKGV